MLCHPSISRIAAMVIDPAIWASTVALQSHRCTPYYGNSSIKAMMQASHTMFG